MVAVICETPHKTTGQHLTMQVCKNQVLSHSTQSVPHMSAFIHLVANVEGIDHCEYIHDIGRNEVEATFPGMPIAFETVAWRPRFAFDITSLVKGYGPTCLFPRKPPVAPQRTET